LALLERRDLPPQALEQLMRNSAVAKLRKVRLALITHPHTPRHVSVPNIRHLYIFELMQIALMPSLAADLKRAAEEALLSRLATISSGERFTLAKRAAGRVAQSTDDRDVDCESPPLRNRYRTARSRRVQACQVGASAGNQSRAPGQ